ncbi:hypothetical protein ACFPJ4_04190 [Lysinimonas soli]|uniref:MFS transporter n=1 Tax=Lysinimonas soli TaxID=1074233 RepID=A0ABW0NQE9_9MICO
MDETPGAEPDSAEAGYQAVVEVGNLTGGMMGGTFDGPRSQRRRGSRGGPPSRSRSGSVISRRVKVIALIVAVVGFALAVISLFVPGAGVVSAVLRWAWIGAVLGAGTFVGAILAERGSGHSEEGVAKTEYIQK